MSKAVPVQLSFFSSFYFLKSNRFKLKIYTFYPNLKWLWVLSQWILQYAFWFRNMSCKLVNYGQFYQRPLNNSTPSEKRKKYNNLCAKDSLLKMSCHSLMFPYIFEYLRIYVLSAMFSDRYHLYLQDNLILSPKSYQCIGKTWIGW